MVTALADPPTLHPVGHPVYTPIFDALVREWRPRLEAAQTDAARAEKDALDVLGGIP